MPKRFLILLSIVTISVAAACSKSSKSSSSSSSALDDNSSTTVKVAGSSTSANTPDCKSLITVAEASAVLGKPASQPEGGLNTTGDAESFCDWNVADKNDFSGFALLQLQAFNSTRFVPKSSYDPAKVHDVTVPGASEAFSISEQATMTQVNFVVKGKRVVISFTPADKKGENHLNEVLTVAAAAAARVS